MNACPCGLPPPPLRLRRHPANPVLSARPENAWESLFVFNAAAVYLAGRVHLLYRAIGEDGISRLGYASSADGVHFDVRPDHPVYEVGRPRPAKRASAPLPPLASGGSWHGCEDPRLTQVGDRLYMTYTDFGGWESPPAVGLTSIAVDDFLAGRWEWEPPHIVSPPGEVHKNWVVFPQLFNGRYAVLHSLKPTVQVDFVDSLDDLAAGDITSRMSGGGFGGGWDGLVRGAGAPPILTDAGWLQVYHAMDPRDPDRYKLGVLLLDRDDPSSVIARLPHPLLEPNAPCENRGFKTAVVYNCGAAVVDGQLLVYYGGADAVLCVASVGLDALVACLVAGAGDARVELPALQHTRS